MLCFPASSITTAMYLPSGEIAPSLTLLVVIISVVLGTAKTDKCFEATSLRLNQTPAPAAANMSTVIRMVAQIRCCLISSKRYSTPEVGLDGPIFFVSLADCWKPLSAVGPPMNSVGASLRGSDMRFRLCLASSSKSCLRSLKSISRSLAI